mgnify:CR=1 FL=1
MILLLLIPAYFYLCYIVTILYNDKFSDYPIDDMSMPFLLYFVTGTLAIVAFFLVTILLIMDCIKFVIDVMGAYVIRILDENLDNYKTQRGKL